MNPYTFFNIFTEALAQDSTLNTWAAANFGRQVTVFEDLEDSAAPDPETDGPYILIVSQGKRTASNAAAIGYTLGLWLALTKAGLITTTDVNIVAPTALKLALDFVHYTQQVIKASLPANTTIQSMEFEVDPISMAPEAHIYIDINFATLVTIGQDPLGLT